MLFFLSFSLFVLISKSFTYLHGNGQYSLAWGWLRAPDQEIGLMGSLPTQDTLWLCDVMIAMWLHQMLNLVWCGWKVSVWDGQKDILGKRWVWKRHRRGALWKIIRCFHCRRNVWRELPELKNGYSLWLLGCWMGQILGAFMFSWSAFSTYPPLFFFFRRRKKGFNLQFVCVFA